ncbi:MAG TPA: hypothetical protein VE995_01360 [Gaiellaceae bacterium]|nr:hypothetical protein [Gaiellaceae bacterium]
MAGAIVGATRPEQREEDAAGVEFPPELAGIDEILGGSVAWEPPVPARPVRA